MGSDGNSVGAASGRFIGAEGMWALLDRLSRATLGVDALAFSRGYPAGEFDSSPIARDLASLLPFARPPLTD